MAFSEKIFLRVSNRKIDWIGEKTNLTIALAEGNTNTQLELVGERIGTLTLDNSDVEFTGDQLKYSFEKPTTPARLRFA